jgi:LacI family transcriptional regulator
MATLKDIARRAGVALSTASYAMNNNSKIKEETRHKVLKAAQELNYIPSGIARSLKKQKTNTIGLFFNSFGGPFFSSIIQGVEEVVVSNGFDLVAISCYDSTTSTAFRYLREKQLDGAIIMGPHVPDELIRQVANKDFPVVVLDRELKADYVYNVLINNTQGAYDAVSHLAKLGHRKIAYFSGPSIVYNNKKRLEGYQKALADHSIPFSPNWVIQGRFTEEGGYQAMKMLIGSNRLPDAIFSGNDEMAIGAVQAMKEANIRVPEDMAIVGFDDIRLASYIQPPLTTICHPKYEWGVMATHLVFQPEKMNDQNRIILPTELVVRDSCGASRRSMTGEMSVRPG